MEDDFALIKTFINKYNEDTKRLWGSITKNNAKEVSENKYLSSNLLDFLIYHKRYKAALALIKVIEFRDIDSIIKSYKLLYFDILELLNEDLILALVETVMEKRGSFESYKENLIERYNIFDNDHRQSTVIGLFDNFNYLSNPCFLLTYEILSQGELKDPIYTKYLELFDNHYKFGDIIILYINRYYLNLLHEKMLDFDDEYISEINICSNLGEIFECLSDLPSYVDICYKNETSIYLLISQLNKLSYLDYVKMNLKISNYDQVDNMGNNAVHQCVRYGNIEFLKYIRTKFDISKLIVKQNLVGMTPMDLLIAKEFDNHTFEFIQSMPNLTIVHIDKIAEKLMEIEVIYPKDEIFQEIANLTMAKLLIKCKNMKKNITYSNKTFNKYLQLCLNHADYCNNIDHKWIIVSSFIDDKLFLKLSAKYTGDFTSLISENNFNLEQLIKLKNKIDYESPDILVKVIESENQHIIQHFADKSIKFKSVYQTCLSNINKRKLNDVKSLFHPIFMLYDFLIQFKYRR